MNAFPIDRSYTAEHEWVMLAPGAPMPDAPVRVGITAVAVEALGDLVHLELPAVGSTVAAGMPCGEVESTKAVSEIYSPASGRITLVNSAALDDPGLIGADPYGAGWLFAVLPTGTSELLTAAQYAEKTSQ
ncbi:glycine cleavage system protein H [Nocardia crassostreae]|uniref:glycine cleavage system protein H n=1 Tax=Nocardia crassostreae TaxID=53428 RepID=UPI00082DEC0A|nr:glycine cleavage system H protein [Nocardia crassostreae]